MSRNQLKRTEIVVSDSSVENMQKNVDLWWAYARVVSYNSGSPNSSYPIEYSIL